MKFILFLTALVFCQPVFAEGCKDQTPCDLNGRSYHVREPNDWDGKTPLPVMLHFHGWGRQGTLIVKHSRISGATAPRNVLLLAPNGLGKTWDFWSPGSRDTDFAIAVIEDAAKRYPIDRENIYISGYSYGAAMAWRFACESRLPIRALLAVAGTIRQSESCSGVPREVRHVHGLRDTVLDFPFGENGDETYPVMLWRNHFDCSDTDRKSEYQTTAKDAFRRHIWSDCRDKQKVFLDIHERGHFIPKGWFAKQLDELLSSKN